MVSTTMNDDGLPANGKVALNEVGKNLKFMPRIYLGKKNGPRMGPDKVRIDGPVG